MATYFDIWRKQYRRLPSVGREGLSTAIEGEEKGEDVEVKFPITPRTSRTKKIVYTVVVLILWLTTAGLFGVAAPHVKKKLDEPSFFPEIPLKTYKFNEDRRFAQERNEESDHAWDSLMPTGRGRVLVSQPWKYNLPPGVDGRKEVDEYGVAVFHQLHCLGVLRQGWFAFLADQDPEDNHKYPFLGTKAAIHCFEYLRQSLMCGADMSLESVSYWGYDGIIHNSHGWGVEHTKCKNWDLVFAITEKHHAESNRTGI